MSKTLANFEEAVKLLFGPPSQEQQNADAWVRDNINYDDYMNFFQQTSYLEVKFYCLMQFEKAVKGWGCDVGSGGDGVNRPPSAGGGGGLGGVESKKSSKNSGSGDVNKNLVTQSALNSININGVTANSFQVGQNVRVATSQERVGLIIPFVKRVVVEDAQRQQQNSINQQQGNNTNLGNLNSNANKPLDNRLKTKLALIYANCIKSDYLGDWPSGIRELCEMCVASQTTVPVEIQTTSSNNSSNSGDGNNNPSNNNNNNAPTVTQNTKVQQQNVFDLNLLDFMNRVLLTLDQELMSEELGRQEVRTLAGNIKDVIKEREIGTLIECWTRILALEPSVYIAMAIGRGSVQSDPTSSFSSIITTLNKVKADCLRGVRTFIGWVEARRFWSEGFVSLLVDVLVQTQAESFGQIAVEILQSNNGDWRIVLQRGSRNQQNSNNNFLTSTTAVPIQWTNNNPAAAQLAQQFAQLTQSFQQAIHQSLTVLSNRKSSSEVFQTCCDLWVGFVERKMPSKVQKLQIFDRFKVIQIFVDSFGIIPAMPSANEISRMEGEASGVNNPNTGNNTGSNNANTGNNNGDDDDLALFGSDSRETFLTKLVEKKAEVVDSIAEETYEAYLELRKLDNKLATATGASQTGAGSLQGGGGSSLTSGFGTVGGGNINAGGSSNSGGTVSLEWCQTNGFSPLLAAGQAAATNGNALLSDVSVGGNSGANSGGGGNSLISPGLSGLFGQQGGNPNTNNNTQIPIAKIGEELETFSTAALSMLGLLLPQISYYFKYPSYEVANSVEEFLSLFFKHLKFCITGETAGPTGFLTTPCRGFAFTTGDKDGGSSSSSSSASTGGIGGMSVGPGGRNGPMAINALSAGGGAGGANNNNLASASSLGPLGQFNQAGQSFILGSKNLGGPGANNNNFHGQNSLASPPNSRGTASISPMITTAAGHPNTHTVALSTADVLPFLQEILGAFVMRIAYPSWYRHELKEDDMLHADFSSFRDDLKNMLHWIFKLDRSLVCNFIANEIRQICELPGLQEALERGTLNGINGVQVNNYVGNQGNQQQNPNQPGQLGPTSSLVSLVSMGSGGSNTAQSNNYNPVEQFIVAALQIFFKIGEFLKDELPVHLKENGPLAVALGNILNCSVILKSRSWQIQTELFDIWLRYQPKLTSNLDYMQKTLQCYIEGIQSGDAKVRGGIST
jgi:hypothetical protein